MQYEDERMNNVVQEQDKQMQQVEDTYNGMMSNTDETYQKLLDEVNSYKDKQSNLQQQQSDLTIEQINQDKQQAQKDYQKEQAGSYADYQKQLAGNSATQLAAGRQYGGGYSESSQVSMFNTYQNRVATAKESYNKAILNYNNSIKEAQLANSSALAEIAHNALQQELSLMLEQFQYKNTLTTELLNQKQNVSNTYWNRLQDVQNQINTENSLAEQVRQYNESMAYQKERDAVSDYQWQQEFNLAKSKSSGGSGGSGGYTLTGENPINETQTSNDYGNSKITPENTNDYYFKTSDGSSGYQPQYIYDKKITKTGLTAGECITDEDRKKYGISNSKNVFKGVDAEGNTAYYVWAGKENGYLPLNTENVNKVLNNKSNNNKSKNVTSTVGNVAKNVGKTALTVATPTANITSNAISSATGLLGSLAGKKK